MNSTATAVGRTAHAPHRTLTPRRPAPRRRRPSNGLAEHRGPRLALSTAPHPVSRRRPTVGPGGLVLAGVLSAVVVVVFIGIAHLRAPHPTPTTDATAVVEVRTGETLADIAARVHPEASTDRVVDRIRELNGISGAQVFPGESLVVPAAAG